LLNQRRTDCHTKPLSLAKVKPAQMSELRKVLSPKVRFARDNAARRLRLDVAGMTCVAPKYEANHVAGAG
jgi:hypothetical protein